MSDDERGSENENEKMKTLMTLLVLVLVTLTNVEAAKATKYHSGINNAFDKSVAGKTLDGHFVQDMCSVYAISLTDALRAKNVKCAWVAIKWAKIDLGHSFVIFEKDGKRYAMDNMMRKPVRVTGTTDLAVAKKLFALRTNLTVEKVCHPMMGVKSNAGVSNVSDILE